MAKYLKGRIKSLGHALKGLRLMVNAGPNMHICLLAVAGMITAGLVLGITAMEWAAIVLCFSLVIATEAINTAIERLCDHLHPDQHPEIGNVKDLSAGATLVVSMGAAVVGFLILAKYLVALLD